MHAQLMGAAGERLQRKPGEMVCCCAAVLPCGDGFAACSVCSLPRRNPGLPGFRTICVGGGLGRGVVVFARGVSANCYPHPQPLPTRGRGGTRGKIGPDRLSGISGGQLRTPQHFPRGDRGLALRVVLHPPAAGGVLAAERQVDTALVVRRSALHQRPVGLADAARLEQPAELGQRLAVAAEHETARGVAIEPMRERGGARQPEPQRAEIIFQALAALGALVHGEARRLVEHQHQAVAIEQASDDLFGGHGHLPRFGETAITTVLMNEAFRRRMNDQPEEKQSWWQRLSGGLKRTSASIGGAVADLVVKRKLDQEMLDEIEEVLIRADLGLDTAVKIAAAVGEGRYDKSITSDEVKAVVAAEVEKVLAPVAKPLNVDGEKPFVVLVVGVNGSGKTTTIGKLAAKLHAEGRSVMLAAGDTFRAAAIDQLNVWGGRSGATVIARAQGSDAAGLAFDALTQARVEEVDVLLVDTAGRLQNKAVLMDELEKIVRVMKKVDPAVPHAVLLVLDATVGQNALSQVEVFRDIAGVTGLVMTKLDGTARGGILVAIAAKFGLPVHFIGVGESIDDLAPFSAREFARAVGGVE